VSPTQWREAERIYAEALGRDTAAREAYLAEACAGDDGLRREVESLLSEAERCGQFLSSAGFESAMRSMAGSGSVPRPRAAAGAAALAPARPAFFWFAIVCGIAVLGMWGCTAYVAYLNTGGKDFGWESLYTRAGWIAVNVYAGGPADGKLNSGDRFLAFNGDTRATRIGPDPFRQFLRPGSDYSIRVLRHGEMREYRLRVQPWHDWGSYPWAATYLILSLVNFSTGLAMALLKPRDRLAHLGFATLGLAAVRNLASPLSAHPGTPPDMEFVLNQLAGLTFPAALAAGYHFIHRMSAASAKEFVWLAIRRLLYGLTAILALSQLLYFAATLRGPAALIGFAFRYFWIVELNLVFLKTSWEAALTVAFGSICALIVWGYWHSHDADYRRRIRWFAAGCTAGIAPEMLLNLIGWLLAISGHRDWLMGTNWNLLRWIADQFMIALPIALTYAVLKHRLLDISVVVRRGLRYMLARRMLQAILILPFLGLILPIVSHPDKSLTESLKQSSSLFNLALLVSIGLVLRYRVPTRLWLDRRFFREAYQQEDILRRLIARIKDLDSLEEVSKLVCNELDLALHPSWLYICEWKDKSGRLAVVQASARGAIDSVAAVPAGILDLLQACGSPRTREPSSANASMDSLVAIPISTNSVSAGGALLLGEKKSEEPYTETDRRLIESVADAIAIAWENLSLKKRVDQGLRERQEVLSRLKPAGIMLLKECPVCGACFESDQEICPADSTELILSLPVERTIGQRYWLEKRIGKGGMGVVFEATDLSLSRKVAVKIMLGHLFGETTALRRFEREARILAQLSHPNIVAIHDFGSLGEDGAYLVMERLTGLSWRAELQRMGKIPYGVAASWFDQLLAGLTAAHEAGIVHRDLKPENVIITTPDRGAHDTDAGLVKILDFGVAKANAFQSGASANLTEAGVVVGTLAYMAPEQLRGGPADRRADIFSVGIMAAEGVTGRLPERNPADGTVLASSITSQLPTRLAELVLKCVAPNPNDRCTSLAAIHEDLVVELRGSPLQI
jgi:hypothetical protein